jgi:hypothetical protein
MSNTGHVDNCGECQESKAFRCPPCDRHYVPILKARVEELQEAILDALIAMGTTLPIDVREKLRRAVGRVE